MSKLDHKYADCPVCRQSIVLMNDGKLARHNVPGSFKKAPPPDAETGAIMRALKADTMWVPTKCKGGSKSP